HTRFSRDWSSDVCSSDLAESQRTEKEAAEAHIAELEVQIERLEADLAAYRTGTVLPPGTPLRNSNGPSTPMRPGSAAGLAVFSPVADRMAKTGISMTQLYTDYVTAKSDLEAERRMN